MFLLRLRPYQLFLLLIIPMLTAMLLQRAELFTAVNVVRLKVIGVNLSTIFAVLFTAWIGTLVWALAPSMVTRSMLIAGLSLSMAFRAWQDSWAIDELYATGKLPDTSHVEMLSPLFVLHALISLFMLYLLVMLAMWLVREEKAVRGTAPSFWGTLLQFLVFPIGLFWIQKRAQAVVKK
jgi:hypothetical protein